MKKDGTITIKGKDITIDGSGKINVKASSDVVDQGQQDHAELARSAGIPIFGLEELEPVEAETLEAFFHSGVDNNRGRLFGEPEEQRPTAFGLVEGDAIEEVHIEVAALAKVDDL